MNAVRNYQKELEKIIEQTAKGLAPTLFLHSCCAPCSSYVLEYLRTFFKITVFYYNPNISSDDEYYKRLMEQKRLIAAYNESLDGALKARNVDADVSNGQTETEARPDVQGYPIKIIEGDYEPEHFYEIAKGLEQCPEGGERCFACYELRLRETAKRALTGQYDYFTTTLTISPLKNAPKLNEIGEDLAKEYGIRWLPSDFKKRGGYQRSVVLSKEYDLYRQDYCGCIYSKQTRKA